MTDRPTLTGDRRIAWHNVMTVISAAILIGAEVFGAAFAGGWALENMTGLGDLVVRIIRSLLSLFGIDIGGSDQAGVFVLQAVLFLAGVAVMLAFIRSAQRVEPFTTKG